MSKLKVDTEIVSGALAERQSKKGRRVKLTKAERDDFIRLQRAERAAALFLDLDEGRTWAEIAEEMEISPHQLRDISKTEEFDTAYNMLFAELGHDPRYKAAQGALADMLPLAIGKLKGLLTGTIAAGTKLRAIEKVIQLNGLENMQPIQSDRQELVTFLVENKIDLTGIKIVLPTEYVEVEEEVIEAEYIGTNPALLDNPDSSSLEDQLGIDQALSDELHFPSEMTPSSSMTESEIDESDDQLEEQLLHQGISEQTAEK